mgnify:CR=1 FL=1
MSGKRLDLTWENFARENEYPLTKDESSESQGGFEKFESLYNAFESSKDKRKWGQIRKECQLRIKMHFNSNIELKSFVKSINYEQVNDKNSGFFSVFLKIKE